MIASTGQAVYRIVSDVFGVPIQEIDDDTSPDTIAKWDSVSHFELILSLEAEFGVSLSPEEAVELLSVGLIRTLLAEHGVAEAQG